MADEKAIQKWEDSVKGELYEDLLNRYERVLVYAGQLQERLRQQVLLTGEVETLEEENERLQRLLDVEKSYVKLLESALERLGVLSLDKEDS